MKAGWEVKPLGDFTEVVTKGTTPTSVGFKFTDTGVNFVKIEAIDLDGKIKPEKLAKISPEAHDALARSQLREGDVLFSIAGALGRITIVEGSILPANTNQALSIIRLAKDAPIDRAFLAYCLSSSAMTEQIAQQQGGVAQQNLSLAQVKSFQIPIPPLEEQKRIVAVLDAAFEGLTRAKENAEANLQNARELFDLTRDNCFLDDGPNWRATTIGELCERVEYGTSQKSLKTGNIPVLRMGNIQRDELDWNDLVFSDNEDDFQKLGLREGDVLFNRTNSAEHVGKTAIYRGERHAIFAGYLIRLHHKTDQVDPEYLNLYLNGNAAREHGKTVMSRSVNQANINGSKLKQYPIRLPSLREQGKIADKLLKLRKSLDDVRSEYTKKLADVADLRQSLLQKAFAGELT